MAFSWSSCQHQTKMFSSVFRYQCSTICLLFLNVLLGALSFFILMFCCSTMRDSVHMICCIQLCGFLWSYIPFNSDVDFCEKYLKAILFHLKSLWTALAIAYTSVVCQLKQVNTVVGRSGLLIQAHWGDFKSVINPSYFWIILIGEANVCLLPLVACNNTVTEMSLHV